MKPITKAEHVNEPIAIIGSACRFPGESSSPSKLWDLLSAPRDVLSEIPPSRFNVDHFYHPDALHHGTSNVRHSYFLSEKEDPRLFDAGFFGIKPVEANSVDPQHRLLLETVYEGIESAGVTMDQLQGSRTGVFVGCMSADYSDLLGRDVDNFPTYFASGTARSIISNRVSYFFDLRGPSMTIDTACSSSLVALHQAVQSLRSNESSAAIVGGCNLLLGPEQYIAESKLNMLSPNGRSRMWDKDADGYARGDGLAVIVLKTLSAALADGDTIECIVRETGINQDGRTKGITMPSSAAQLDLIRSTYAKAGLDLSKAADRPQFFEAHGTGTPAGDPQEAEAISGAFFGAGSGFKREKSEPPLYVGSIKTVIGHTEGTAGLAALIKGMMAINHRLIPPNMLMNELSPTVRPFCENLEVPTEPKPWPTLPVGARRRVSINSFGFGGANAHAILEEFVAPSHPRASPQAMAVEEDVDMTYSTDSDSGISGVESPTRHSSDHVAHTASSPFATFNFSAASEKSLMAMMKSYAEFVAQDPAVTVADLSWTLNSKRSTLPVRASVAASTIPELVAKLEEAVADGAKARLTTVSAATSAGQKPARFLGVFTGQGAQWAGMGAKLLQSEDTYKAVSACLDGLQKSLDTLPDPTHRPSWTLKEELLKQGEDSNIGKGEFSQPLVTAVQLCLLEVLKIAGIRLAAVVGHSAGETAAACAAGYLSAHDAIRVAYYRGYFLQLARGTSGMPIGGMMAVGSDWEDLQALCQLPIVRGKINIAAYNSPESCTLSGDLTALAEAQEILEEEGKFARRLKLDLPYHSKYMEPCAAPYTAALEQTLSGVSTRQQREAEGRPVWISSVYVQHMEDADAGVIRSVAGSYWSKNMCSPVKFSQALEYALGAHGPFDMAIEIGPHPALKSPALQAIAAITGSSKPLPYTGLLARGKHDGEALAEALGAMWLSLGESAGIDHLAFASKVLLPRAPINIKRGNQKKQQQQPRFLKNLPSYPWDHDREYWAESRQSIAYRTNSLPSHQLLGTRCPDGTDHDQVRWKNMLHVREVPWLKHHSIQGQCIFPAAGYISAAVEAAVALYGLEHVQLLDFSNVTIGQAMILQENTGTESLFSLRVVASSSPSGSRAKAAGMARIVDCDFSMHSASARKDANSMVLHASGRMRVTILSDADVLASSHALPHPTKPAGASFGSLEPARFYEAMADLGIGYTGPFAKIVSAGRRLEEAVGSIEKPADEDQAPGFQPLLVHPGTLDCAIQAILLAFNYPGDGRMKSIFLPTKIERLRISPKLASADAAGSKLPFYASLASSVSSVMPSSSNSVLSGDVEVYSASGESTIFQLQGLHATPLERPSVKDDFKLFSEMIWQPAAPTGETKSGRGSADPDQLTTLERVAYYYLKMLVETFPPGERDGLDKHHLSLLAYADHSAAWVASGTHPFARKEWAADTREDIRNVMASTPSSIDLRLMRAVGENIVAVMRQEMNILEAMTADNMLGKFYRDALGMDYYLAGTVRMISQLTHRFPHLDILEVGAGTGGATNAILGDIGEAFGSYTYTDISSGFFGTAQSRFEQAYPASSHKMIYKTLDIEKDPVAQGHAPHSFDLVVASLVLHATVDLEVTMANVRKLLRPGGWLVMLEIAGDYDPAKIMRLGFIFGSLPGWWLGREADRKLSPCVSVARWRELMQKTGFSDIDAIVPFSKTVPMPFTALACQAVDDRVTFLRNPLASSEAQLQQAGLSGLGVDNLTIIGGKTPRTASLIQRVRDLVGPHYRNPVRLIQSLEDIDNADSLPFLGSVVSLVDVDDESVFKDLDDPLMPAKLSAFKNLFKQSKNVLWVSTGTYDGSQPHNAMIVGFQRTLVLEMPHLRFQHLDLAPEVLQDGAGAHVAKKLLQLEATDAWEQKDDRPVDQLWYTEPAVSVKKGGLELVPRLRHNARRNTRHNAGRRVITEDVNLDEAGKVLSLRPVDDADHRDKFSVREKGIAHGSQFEGDGDVGQTRGDIRMSHSLLRPLPITDSDHLLYLCTGQDIKTGASLVFLTKALDSWVDASDIWSVPARCSTDAQALKIMLRLYTHSLSHVILRGIPAGKSVAILNADYALAAVLSRRAAERGIHIALLTTEDGRSEPWTYVHPLATREHIKKLVPADTIRFVDMINHAATDDNGFGDGNASQLVSAIVSCLRPSCSLVSWDMVMGVGPSLQDSILWSKETNDVTVAVLQTIWAECQTEVTSISVPSVSLSDIARAQTGEHLHDLANKLSGQAVVRWRGDLVSQSATVPVQVQPASSLVGFSKDKTYWLVGLSGGLGLSLAEWMARKGAGFIVISSRDPNKVEKAWISAMKATHGCTIRVFANDVTSRNDVRALHKRIVETLPPIGGVTLGAMVLHDTMFPDLDMERLTKVLRPKINGSLYLDEIFSDSTENEDTPALDHFVFLSSMAYVVGNHGQSAYAGANAFLTGLAEQRRRRGQAASAVNIGAIVGKGYFSREMSVAGKAAIFRLGNQFMSEHDFHEMFAECVLAGQPDGRHDGSPEISTGIRRLEIDEELPLWASNPIFQHLVPHASVHLVGRDGSGTGAAGNGNLKSAVNIKAQLLEATSADQVFAVLKEGLLLKLQVALQADPAKLVIEQSPDELGVDSLVAVDLRSWFLKELGVDMPVLKVLSAGSVKELLEAGQELLPMSMVPKLSSADGTQAASKPSQPQPATGGLKPRMPPPPLAPQAVAAPTVDPPASTSSAGSERHAVASRDSWSIVSQTSTLSSAGDTPCASPELTRSALSKSSDTSYSDADEPSEKMTLQPPSAPKPLGAERTLPMSFAQTRFWFLRHFVHDPAAFNVTSSLSIRGPLDPVRLASAIQAVVGRHEALRTFFFTDPQTGEHMQGVLPAAAAPLRLEHERIDQETHVARAVAELKSHVFDIERGELMRVRLLTLAPDRHWIVHGYHHINMDGLGYPVFWADVDKAYRGALGRGNGGMLQYPDFALRQRRDFETGAWEQELAFWRGRFATIPEPYPLLPLSRLASRPSSGSNFGSHRVSIDIDPSLVAMLGQMCRGFKATAFHVYLAVFEVFLFRLAGYGSADDSIQDICIGVADGNRKDADVLPSLGLFLNLLPLRFPRPAAEQTFGHVLKAARAVAQDAFAHSRVPFDMLVKDLGVPRTSSHSPLFQTFLNYRQNVTLGGKFFDGCQVEGELVAAGQHDYDIALDVVDSTARTWVTLEVRKDLYSQDAAETLLNSFHCLLRAFVSNPAAKAAWPDLYSQEDVESAIEAGRGVELPVTTEGDSDTLVHLVDDNIQTYAHQPALICNDDSGPSLAWREMGKRIDSISQALAKALGGTGRGKRVGVYQAPGKDWISSFLAILKTGAAYIPLDPKLSTSRICQIVKDSEPAVILVDHQMECREFAALVSNTCSDIINISRLPFAVGAKVENQARPDEEAVIMYTSGSTGTPKGIVLTHSALYNWLQCCKEVWNMRPGQETILQHTFYTFDLSLGEMILSLGLGGTLVVAGATARGDPVALAQLIASHNVTVTIGTPTSLLTWLQRSRGQGILDDCQWRVALTGGEPIPNALVREFRRLGRPQLTLFGFYGPAEIVICSATAEIRYQDAVATDEQDVIHRTPLKTMPNYSTYIVDDKLNVLPRGVPGEIVTGGLVARGYLNNPDATAEKFVVDKHASFLAKSRGWTTMHRSGDMGRLTQDGGLLIDGRIAGDTQVKIGGIRMDLCDIEATITQTCPSIDLAVVSARKAEGTQFLVAFVVFSEGSPVEERSRLLRQLPVTLPLPQYMRPSLCVELSPDKVPKTSSGKVDRASIQDLPLPRQNMDELSKQLSSSHLEDEQLTATEAALRDLWFDAIPSGIAGQHIVNKQSDFFHVGGSSLALINLQGLIKDRLHVNVPLHRLFAASTLSGMAATVDPAMQASDSSQAAINWENEVEIPADVISAGKAQIQSRSWKSKPPSVVILTGATGFVGREILQRLVANGEVSKVHCLAVRKSTGELDPASLYNHPKVVIHAGNLGAPRLGLASEAEARGLFDSADVVIHNGADVSFMKTYQTLRETNVRSTKELVRLALPNRTAFHFISSASVVARLLPSSYGEGLEAKSMALHPPATGAEGASPVDGYTAAKWVSEVYLERVAATLGLPVTIHRPSSITGDGAPELDLMTNMVKYAKVLKAVPDLNMAGGGGGGGAWKASLDFVTIEKVGSMIVSEVLRVDGQTEPHVRYVDETGGSSVDAGQLKELMEMSSGGRVAFATLPIDQWADAAEQAGMNPMLAMLVRRSVGADDR